MEQNYTITAIRSAHENEVERFLIRILSVGWIKFTRCTYRQQQKRHMHIT